MREISCVLNGWGGSWRRLFLQHIGANIINLIADDILSDIIKVVAMIITVPLQSIAAAA